MRAAGRNAVASVVTALTGIAAALLSTPLILHHVGREAYGVWVVAMAFVIYLGIVEAGLAPAAQRFVALSLGSGDHGGAARVFWSNLVLYLAMGLLACGLVELLAPTIVGIFHFPQAIHSEATALLRTVGLALPLGLVVAALSNVLQGYERFTAIAVTTAFASLTYVVALVVLVSVDASLSQMAWAVIAQQLVLLLMRAALSIDVLTTRPSFVSRREGREMAAMSARLQVSVLSLLVNGQSDRVVAGLVAPPAEVGQVGIASQVAESGRLVAAAPLVPLTNRFATLDGTGDGDGLRAAFRRADRTWTVALLGGVVIGTACAAPLVRGWLGAGYDDAELFAAMLVLAYGTNLLLGVRTAYLRGTGNAGLESRGGVMLMALNLLFTVPLAIAFGATGVIAGTLAAYLLGTAWFVRWFPRIAPDAHGITARDLLRPILVAIPVALLAGAWGVLMAAEVPTGWALVPIGLGAAAAWLAYLMASLGIRPRPSELRALLRSDEV
jgi:O-antigen/teichoic acid export membrane protein